ncbi:SIS domain-containing protein [Brachyspira sp.]|uniref:SIS domain-containing protein n=1 Tax=Brachyspira sp. TaxID=1977261 RepID=UPI00262FCCCD|nr:SIS domain-containing protein [Brachyspira sp.]
MLNFNEENYRKSLENGINECNKIIEVADTISKEGYDNIYFLGVGGSLSIMKGVVHIMSQISLKINFYAESASFIGVVNSKRLNEKSCVVMISKSGDTKETLQAAKILKEKNIRIFSIVGKSPSPISELSYKHVINEQKVGSELMYIMLLTFCLRLAYNNQEYPMFNDFINDIKKLPDELIKAKIKFDPIAEQLAKQYSKETYHLWIGTGYITDEVYLFAMCILEEMLWIKTKSITSEEFFHGTLEIVEKDTFVGLIKNMDETRVLDERAEKFLKNITDKLFVLDLKDYVSNTINKEFYSILSPIFMASLCSDRIANHFSKEKDHDLNIRRYYRKMEY